MVHFPNSVRVRPGDPVPASFEGAVSTHYTPPAQAARDRGSWYALAAALCHAPPAEAVVEAVASGELGRRAESVVAGAAAAWPAGEPEPELGRADFFALFKVPGARYVTANESVWADRTDIEGNVRKKGLLMGPSTLDMGARWRAIGVQPDTRLGELPDFLGLELHYLECVCAMEAAAWEAGQLARACALLDLQRAFHDDHLSRWVGDVGEKIRLNARSRLYQGLGWLLPALARSDRELLGRILVG